MRFKGRTGCEPTQACHAPLMSNFHLAAKAMSSVMCLWLRSRGVYKAQLWTINLAIQLTRSWSISVLMNSSGWFRNHLLISAWNASLGDVPDESKLTNRAGKACRVLRLLKYNVSARNQLEKLTFCPASFVEGFCGRFRGR